MNVFRQIFTADDPRGPWPARDFVKAVDKASENLRDWSASQEEWSELCELQYVAEDAPAGPEKDAACRRMAELLESYADRVERSGLVRALGLSSPESLRAEAAEWRAGRRPE